MKRQQTIRRVVATKAGESGNQGVVTHAEPVLPQKPVAGSPPRPVRYNQMSCVVYILRYVSPLWPYDLATFYNSRRIRRFYSTVNFYCFLSSNVLYFSNRSSCKGFYYVDSLFSLMLPVSIGYWPLRIYLMDRKREQTYTDTGSNLWRRPLPCRRSNVSSWSSKSYNFWKAFQHQHNEWTTVAWRK